MSRLSCLVLNGTGRKGGLCDHFGRLVCERIWSEGGICEEATFHKCDIGICTGCGACRNGECPILDGYGITLDVMDQRDLVVFISPIRFSGLSSQIKVMIDRLNRLWYNHDGVHAKSCAILVGGSSEPKFSNAESELRAVSKGCGFEWSGVLELSGSDDAPEGAYDEQVLAFIEGVLEKIR